MLRRDSGSAVITPDITSAAGPGEAVTTRCSPGFYVIAYRRTMQDADEIRDRKRRCNLAVLAGVTLMAVALFISSRDLAPPIATTAAAVVGFVLVGWGVHVGWLVFYDREPDGPPC